MNKPHAVVARSFWLCVVLAPMTGCGLDVTGNILVNPPGNGPAPDTVTVVFRNQTETDAVDVQFYASNAVLQNVTQELFVDANKVLSNIGVAGTGIIQPNDADVISVPCANDLSVGTVGGRFLDNETGALSGQGIMRWAQERPLGLCGGVVRFDFYKDGATFQTSIRVLDVADVSLPSSP